MKVEIEKLNKNLPAVEALLMQKNNVSVVHGDHDDYEIMMGEDLDDISIVIYCHGIVVNNDRISFEFIDGSIGDYEISNGDYAFITIL